MPVILIESAALRVEHQMLVCHREETLVIRFLALFVLLGYAGRHGVDALQFLLALVQSIVINVLGRTDGQIQRRLVQNREQIAGDPVDAYTNSNESSQGQRNQNGEPICHPLLALALLFLQRIQFVLPDTKHPRRHTCRHRHQQASTAQLTGNLCVDRCRITAQHRLDRGNNAHQQHQLDHHGNGAGDRVILFLLIELLCFLGDRVLIAIILNF